MQLEWHNFERITPSQFLGDDYQCPDALGTDQRSGACTSWTRPARTRIALWDSSGGWGNNKEGNGAKICKFSKFNKILRALIDCYEYEI